MKTRAAKKKAVRVLLPLLGGAAWLLAMSFADSTPVAQNVTVTSILAKDLSDVAGKEFSVITVEYAPGGSDSVHTHHAHALVCMLKGLDRHAGERRRGCGH